MLDRRTVLAAAPCLLVAHNAVAQSDPFAGLEARHGGRLGVAALDTGSKRRLAWRADERFPMCSTFKTLLVSDLLARVDRHAERLDRRIAFGPADLLDFAPVTRAHVNEGGMTLGALAAAAASYSDNTAANLLLAHLGGPAGVTAYVRTLGDTVTRLDRTEPGANTCVPGDPRDTTSPSAMLGDLQTLAFGHALSETSRTRLITWLADYQMKGVRIPAGIPASWRSADKMGTGAHATANDVAVLWPPGRAPILVAAYYTASQASRAEQDALLADVGRIVVQRFS
ncbi:MAG TPA: class A beta-lactamase [Rhizomicrobium sp.]|nr:class A beta-lactamase [Rhizomicrobium sp.]